jgi:hypothetical protein
MRLPGRRFAIALWIIAAFLIVAQILTYFGPQTGVRFGPMSLWVGLLPLINTLVYAAALVGLGAAVWLLGEIRDQLLAR